ncbi:MAG: peptidylprolyl isomerase, partial [bacterium]
LISWIVIANNKDNQIRMKKVYESINNNDKSFSDWAKEISQDKKTSAIGGKLGKLSDYSFDKEEISQIESLIYPGQITKPLISTSKIAMFKLDKFIPERQKEFDEVKNILIMNIKSNYVKRKLLELDQSLMKKDDLIVNDKVFLDIIENGIQ